MADLPPPAPLLPTAPQQGEVYKITGNDCKAIDLYAKRLTGEGHDYYRVPSWPVVFLGFEEFDLRTHRSVDAVEGWTISEATTGMSVVKVENSYPEAACDRVAFLIAGKKLTVEKLREAVIKGGKTLKELGLGPSSEIGTQCPVPPAGHCNCRFSSGGVLSKSCAFHDEQRKDAERYRWMKREVKRIPPGWDLIGWDAAIDAARTQSREPT